MLTGEGIMLLCLPIRVLARMLSRCEVETEIMLQT
jgi:hypothetical protein